MAGKMGFTTLCRPQTWQQVQPLHTFFFLFTFRLFSVYFLKQKKYAKKMLRKSKASFGECGWMVGDGGLGAGLAARGLTADGGTTPAASLAPRSCREGMKG